MPPPMHCPVLGENPYQMQSPLIGMGPLEMQRNPGSNPLVPGFISSANIDSPPFLFITSEKFIHYFFST